MGSNCAYGNLDPFYLGDDISCFIFNVSRFINVCLITSHLRLKNSNITVYSDFAPLLCMLKSGSPAILFAYIYTRVQFFLNHLAKCSFRKVICSTSVPIASSCTCLLLAHVKMTNPSQIRHSPCSKGVLHISVLAFRDGHPPCSLRWILSFCSMRHQIYSCPFPLRDKM